MASIYAKGPTLYMKIKKEGRWRAKATPYRVGQEREAMAFASECQRQIDEREAAVPEVVKHTVRSYATEWNRERLSRVRSALGEMSIFERHIFPCIGDMRLTDVSRADIRDMVRTLRRKKLAPRTVHNIYALARNMFAEAELEDLIPRTPCRLRKGELPAAVDKDPEWRGQATFTREEMHMLMTDERVPWKRRMLHALKGMVGMRHGEAAALRWRHITDDEPLGRITIAVSFDSNHGEEKRTKTSVTRVVPLHPFLRDLLDGWRSVGWELSEGRPPTDDDLVVPGHEGMHYTRFLSSTHTRRDLETLGLRVMAGKHRGRGGHDLRSWFKTTLIVDGADSAIVRRFTHAPPRDVEAGYIRFPWEVLCRELAKLRMPPLGTGLVPQGEGASNRGVEAVEGVLLDG